VARDVVGAGHVHSTHHRPNDACETSVLPIDRGASAVEYGLVVVAIAAVVVAVVFALGGVINTMFSDSCSRISSEAGTTSTC